MDRGLVTLAGTETGAALLKEAAEHARGANADLVLLSTFTREEADHDLEVLNRIETSEHGQFGELMSTELAEEVGEQIARSVLSAYDVEYTVVGAITDHRIGRRIIDEAERRDCDHVFLLGKPHSRIENLGEAARRVVRHFDGFTTIGRERNPERHFARLRGTGSDYEVVIND
ncbi:universal stress protein [Halobacteria archaeon AArc-m2/3/4]|uniref:Universal stress protein n=1 Tax=Natronoglomus mannanivorans TaxID=2979990 RepID=A0AAP2Z496_9EURY|nr:universal stress protein [Halobacteria archaeon AArc-xg1-1]MCU4974947.1 universal stress protein [Halobacteria archaeon AArc-m2/3/4]